MADCGEEQEGDVDGGEPLPAVDLFGLIQPRLAFGTVSAVRTDCGSITAAGGVAEIVGLRMPGLPGPPECLLSQSGGTTPDRRAGQAIGGGHSPEQRKSHGPWPRRARPPHTTPPPAPSTTPASAHLH